MIVREVVSFMEGEWSCYRGGQFNGGRIVVTKDTCIVEGGIVMLRRWSI